MKATRILLSVCVSLLAVPVHAFDGTGADGVAAAGELFRSGHPFIAYATLQADNPKFARLLSEYGFEDYLLGKIPLKELSDRFPVGSRTEFVKGVPVRLQLYQNDQYRGFVKGFPERYMPLEGSILQEILVEKVEMVVLYPDADHLLTLRAQAREIGGREGLTSAMRVHLVRALAEKQAGGNRGRAILNLLLKEAGYGVKHRLKDSAIEVYNPYGDPKYITVKGISASSAVEICRTSRGTFALFVSTPCTFSQEMALNVNRRAGERAVLQVSELDDVNQKYLGNPKRSYYERLKPQVVETQQSRQVVDNVNRPAPFRQMVKKGRQMVKKAQLGINAMLRSERTQRWAGFSEGPVSAHGIAGFGAFYGAQFVKEGLHGSYDALVNQDTGRLAGIPVMLSDPNMFRGLLVFSFVGKGVDVALTSVRAPHAMKSATSLMLGTMAWDLIQGDLETLRVGITMGSYIAGGSVVSLGQSMLKYVPQGRVAKILYPVLTLGAGLAGGESLERWVYSRNDGVTRPKRLNRSGAISGQR